MGFTLFKRSSTGRRAGIAIVFSLVCLLLPALQGGKLGKLSYSPTFSVGAEYSSNINASSVNPQEDVLLFTRLQVDGEMPLTRFNTIDFGLGIGYNYYINGNSDVNRNDLLIQMAPDLNFSFTVRIFEHMQIIVTEALSFSRDPTDVAGVDENNNLVLDIMLFNHMLNNIKVDYLWSLNARTQFKLGWSRLDRIPLDSIFDNTQRTDTSVNTSLQRQLGMRVYAGIQAGWTQTRYKTNFQNDGDSQNYGIFTGIDLSSSVQLYASINYLVQDFDNTGLVQDSSNPESWLYTLRLTHALNTDFSYYLELGRTEGITYLANSNITDRITWAFTWNGWIKSKVEGTARYEWSTDSGGPYADDFERMFFQLRCGWQTGSASQVSFYARYTNKDSKIPNRSYDQHVLGIDWSYRF